MPKDLRTFLSQLQDAGDRHLLEIKEALDCRHEIAAVLQLLEDERRYPAVLCHRVRNLAGEPSAFPVLTNLFADRDRLGLALGASSRELGQTYMERERPVPCAVVDRSAAPVKDVVRTGDDIDLFQLPALVHHEADPGGYLTAGDSWIRNPDTGEVNCAILRLWVKDRRQLVVYFEPTRHTALYVEKYHAAGRPAPIAITLGHHPLFYLGAQTKTMTHEPDIIGGVLGEPLEVVAPETLAPDFPVPARAEFVIEGEILPDRVKEGPFGEFLRYYGREAMSCVLNVTAVTHRRDAIFLDIFAGHRDHFLIDVPVVEGNLLRELRRAIPSVVNVHFPASGSGRMHLYVQLKKRSDAEPRTVIARALSAYFMVKHVIVVDEDVDIFDEEQVLWAVASHTQWDRDLVVLPRMVGINLDPSTSGPETTKGGIDATRKAQAGSVFPARVAVSPAALAHVRAMKLW
ncbi:MAG: UbiD family decarboxylase [Candidatus Rokubacteria bacterium]|nr:UbiD family decarboxylase [Candidatus Rokubacteria bacterium]